MKGNHPFISLLVKVRQSHQSFKSRKLQPLIFAFTIILTTMISSPAPAITPEELLSDPTLEKRARALSKQLRCLVCQNHSIDDSDAGLARDLRDEVRNQIAAGKSDSFIIGEIRQKYGDYVLLNPPVDQNTLFLWLAPFGFLGFGAVVVLLARRNHATPTSLKLDVKDQARINAMLSNHSRVFKKVKSETKE